MEFQAYDIALIPVIIAVVAALAKAGMPSKYSPILSIIIGIAIGVVYIAPSNLAQAILSGVVMGLSSIGAYSGVKNTIQKR